MVGARRPVDDLPEQRDDARRIGHGDIGQLGHFRDSLTDLNGAGITVLGISPDAPAKLAKFRD